MSDEDSRINGLTYLTQEAIQNTESVRLDTTLLKGYKERKNTKRAVNRYSNPRGLGHFLSSVGILICA